MNRRVKGSQGTAREALRGPGSERHSGADGGARASERSVGLVSFATLFVIGTDTLLVAPLLPLLQRELGVDVARSGWLVSAYSLGYALFALLAGPLSDRADRRRVLLSGVVAFTIFTAACGAAWGFWSLFLMRLLAGVAAAFVTPQIWASIPMVVAPASVVRTMGYATAGLAVAQVAGIPLGSFLSAQGWRLPFFAIAVASALLWALLAARFPSVPPSPTSESRLFGAYAHVVRSRVLVLSLIAYLVFQLGNFTALSFVGTWFARDFGATQNMIGWAMVVIGLGNAIGSLNGSRLVARVGARPFHVGGIVAMAIVYGLSSFVSSLWAGALIVFGAMLVGGALFPVLMAQLQSHTTAARGTVSSLANAAMYAGTTIGGAVGGPLLTRFPGYSGVAMFAVAAYTASLAIYALAGAFRRE